MPAIALPTGRTARWIDDHRRQLVNRFSTATSGIAEAASIMPVGTSYLNAELASRTAEGETSHGHATPSEPPETPKLSGIRSCGTAHVSSLGVLVELLALLEAAWQRSTHSV